MRIIFSVCLAAFLTLPVLAQADQFTMETRIAQRGERASGYLEIPAGVDEGTRLPMTILHGVKPGLVLLLPAIVIGVAAMALHGASSLAFDLPRALVMIVAYSVYFAVFIGLSLMVSARASSSRMALVVLLGFWFFNCLIAARLASELDDVYLNQARVYQSGVILPALVNLVATALYPVPSRIEFVNAMRVETQEANQKGSQLLGKYFEDHPELAKPASTKDAASKSGEDDFAMLSLAKNEMVAQQMKPLLERFDAQLQAQHRFVNRFRFVSPAIVMQSLLYDITGTGIERYQHFLAQVGDYHQRWQQYFSPRIFEKRALTSGDLASLPQFAFAEEATLTVAQRALWPCAFLAGLTLWLGWLGLRAYRRFPIVG